jgi:hypothetical protein
MLILLKMDTECCQRLDRPRDNQKAGASFAPAYCYIAMDFAVFKARPALSSPASKVTNPS